MNTVSVIIVSRDLTGMLSHCILALNRALDSAVCETELFVVDNASEFPYVQKDIPRQDTHLLRFDLSQSFAKANNTAACKAKGDVLLLLNNDVLLHDRTIHCMMELLKANPEAGICGTRMLYPEGTIQHCGVVFGEHPRGPYHVHVGAANNIVPRANREYQAVTGACMMIRRQVWEELAGLEEAYPFGLEDIDFCLRAGQKGWKVLNCNDTDSLHFESMTPGRSELDIPSRKLFLQRWKGKYRVDG